MVGVAGVVGVVVVRVVDVNVGVGVVVNVVVVWVLWQATLALRGQFVATSLVERCWCRTMFGRGGGRPGVWGGRGDWPRVP